LLPAVTGMDNGPRATYGMMYKKYVKKEDNITMRVESGHCF